MHSNENPGKLLLNLLHVLPKEELQVFDRQRKLYIHIYMYYQLNDVIIKSNNQYLILLFNYFAEYEIRNDVNLNPWIYFIYFVSDFDSVIYYKYLFY